MKTPPIEPQDYLYGMKVVDIGDLRVARGKSRREHSVCPHKNLTYDDQERRIYCSDCESDVDPFDAFVGVCQVWHAANRELKKRNAAVEAAEQSSLFSRAAKALDQAWRKRRMIPCCPHCDGGLLPEDFANGIRASMSAELERARRKRLTRGPTG